MLTPPELVQMPIRPPPPESFTQVRAIERRNSELGVGILRRQSLRLGKSFQELSQIIRYMLSTGIRTSTLKIMCLNVIDKSVANDQLELKYWFTSDGAYNHVDGYSYKANYTFTFYDYAPFVFREIRRSNFIDCDQYLHCLAADPDGNSLENMISEGKSAANFFRSANGMFVIKTLTEREFLFLRTILSDYYEVCFIIISILQILEPQLEEPGSNEVNRFLFLSSLFKKNQILC
jgi:hypothetical protein